MTQAWSEQYFLHSWFLIPSLPHKWCLSWSLLKICFPFPCQWFFYRASTLKFVFSVPSKLFPCFPSYSSLWCSSFFVASQSFYHINRYCTTVTVSLFCSLAHIFYSIHLLPCSCSSSNQLSNKALVASGEWVICFPYNFSSDNVKCANFAVSWKGLMY